jgi:predicted outer membrane repeat protein
VQNLTFANGNSKNEAKDDGGGAIYASGGRLKVINSRFMNNICTDNGSDLGGGAIRAFQQWNGLPVYVVNSTFGGSEGMGNVCANGGALSSIGVSWTVLNTIISYNRAIGEGGNAGNGGSGGGIYNDGNTMTLTLGGVRMEYNQVNAYGSAIFFVSNDKTGNIVIDSSVITNNLGGSWYPTYPQISNHAETPITVTNSTIE